jgi:hypothetical protein
MMLNPLDVPPFRERLGWVGWVLNDQRGRYTMLKEECLKGVAKGIDRFCAGLKDL